MRFGVVTVNNKKVYEYWKRSKKRFDTDAHAKKYVHRDVKVKKVGKQLLSTVEFSTLFKNDMFRIMLYMIVFTGIVFKIILGFTLIPFAIGAIIVSLPMLIQQPVFVYLVIRYQMRRVGYKGRIQFLSGSDVEVIKAWL